MEEKVELTVDAISFCGTCEDDGGEEEGAAEGFAASGEDSSRRQPVVTRVPPPACTWFGLVESGGEALPRVGKGRRQLQGRKPGSNSR